MWRFSHRGAISFPRFVKSLLRGEEWGGGEYYTEQGRNQVKKGEKQTMERNQDGESKRSEPGEDEPLILDEIDIEEVFVDGICGVY